MYRPGVLLALLGLFLQAITKWCVGIALVAVGVTKVE